MKQVIFEKSPALVLACLLAAAIYAFVLYQKKGPWSQLTNRLLFGLRALIVFLLAMFLLEPLIRQVINEHDKPRFIIVNDNSASIREVTKSTQRQSLQNSVNQTATTLRDHGFDVTITNLTGDAADTLSFDAPSSDITTALKTVASRYEGQQIAGVLLLSDGIFNTGLSPLYSGFNFPISTLGVGDTTERIDIAVKQVAYNKIAYQGNKYPVHAEILVKGLHQQSITVSLTHKGQVVSKQTKPMTQSQLVSFDFDIMADEQGIQQLEIDALPHQQERNLKNNHQSIFVEVVEGKKKILVVAPTPHPDIKAIRSVVEKNANYDFLLHIPGVAEQNPANMKPADIDLAIFLQAPDYRGKTNALVQQFLGSKTSLLFQLGQQSDVNLLNKLALPFRFVTPPRDFDEVTPAKNASFSHFILSPEYDQIIQEYPPASVHFCKTQIQPDASVLLYQQIGSVTTEKPMLITATANNKKIGVLFVEGIWRWRLNEYDRTENTLAFDELFGKLFQYLSTQDDKRKFKCYPVQQQFSEHEPVVVESQAYNDIFEPVYGQTVALKISNKRGETNQYSYTTNPGNTRYTLGNLKEGIYHLEARTTLNGKQEVTDGDFVVTAEQDELQNLTADFDLLRKLSSNTGGQFASFDNRETLLKSLSNATATQTIHSEERLDSVLNLKWTFFLLLLLLSTEWFIRKYQGGY